MNAKDRQKICYLDTNIFIYMFDKLAGEKYDLANELYLHYLRQGNGRISVQVISEWRNTVVKKFADLVDTDTRRTFIHYLTAWQPLFISPEIILKADKLCDRYEFSVYDSIHIQAALDLGCELFLTEDLQNGQMIEDRLRIVNPFAN